MPDRPEPLSNTAPSPNAAPEPVRGDGETQVHDYLRDLDFESMPPEEMLTWASRSWPAGRAVLSTSLQAAGTIMIHMAATLRLPLRIATIDTLRLHPETYTFRRELEERYGIAIEMQRPDPAQVDSMVERFGEYLFFDSKARQEYCCQVRKTRPNDELLASADCWITGVRRDQSDFRRDTPKATAVPAYGTRRHILKLSPLADWSDDQVGAFVEEHQVPVHPLYERGYLSIGCAICSTPSLPGEDKRAGRWRWFNDERLSGVDGAKECGLHVPTYDI